MSSNWTGKIVVVVSVLCMLCCVACVVVVIMKCRELDFEVNLLKELSDKLTEAVFDYEMGPEIRQSRLQNLDKWKHTKTRHENNKQTKMRQRGLSSSGEPSGPIDKKGDKGDRGPKGDTGLRGPKGDTGQKGTRGEKGMTGPRGLLGPKGDSCLTAAGHYTEVGKGTHENYVTELAFQTEAAWMNGSSNITSPLNNLGGGTFKANLTGLYLIYCHVVFRDAKPKQSITVLHEGKPVFRCIESVDYWIKGESRTGNSREKTCSVTGILYVRTEEEIKIKINYPDTRVYYKNNGTYFGAMLLSPISQ